MSTPHELHEEFPGKAEAIHNLKESNAHFRHLADDYHTTNRAIHRAETRVDTLSEAEEHRLKQHRAHLKDEIARLLG